jgi:lipoate-protein ligase A
MLFDELTEVLDPEPHAAALNMAIDEVLLTHATGPLLRIYRWAHRAVSFGYFGKIAEVEPVWPERELVRRWTGGGIVPHGEDVTYTLIVPRTHPFFQQPVEESYCAVHQHIGALLIGQGSRVHIAPAAAAKVSNDCFENPARYDLIAETGKIAGAAQRRTRAGLLHQGSVQGGEALGDLRLRLAPAFGTSLVSRILTAEELAEAQTLAAQKYATVPWLRRF